MNLDRPKLGIPALILLGAALGLAYNALSHNPLPWVAQARTVGHLEESATGADEQQKGTPKPAEAKPAETAKPSGEEGAKPAGSAEEPAKGSKDGEGAAPNVADAGVPESEFPVMASLEQAKALYDKGLLRVLDARDLDEYSEGHIAGAECAPFDDKAGDEEWLSSVAEDPRIILCYCGGGGCELSMNLGFAVSQAGHKRVLVYEDGYPGWKDAGYPVKTGEEP